MVTDHESKSQSERISRLQGDRHETLTAAANEFGLAHVDKPSYPTELLYTAP